MTSCVRSCQQVFQLVLRDAILSFLQSCRSRNVLVHVSNTIVICCTLGCNDPLWSKVLSCGSRVDLKRNFVDLFFLFDVKLLNVVMYGYVHHGTRGRNHGPILKNQWLLWKCILYGHHLARLLWKRQFEKSSIQKWMGEHPLGSVCCTNKFRSCEPRKSRTRKPPSRRSRTSLKKCRQKSRARKRSSKWHGKKAGRFVLRH